jgi:hypothetical protein
MKISLLFLPLLGLLLPQLCAQPAFVAQGAKPSYSEKYDLQNLSLPPGGHFQGIQRWQSEGQDRLFLSASSDSVAYLVELDRRGEVSPQLHVLDSIPLKHAGGFQICEDWLVVGIEDNESRDYAEVVGYDLRKREGEDWKPAFTIERAGVYERVTAGAVAMTRWEGRYLLMVASWDSRSIDVYQSQPLISAREVPQFSLWGSWEKARSDRSEWSDPEFGNYQNLQLLVGEQGELWVAAMFRQGKREQLDWFRLQLDPTDLPRMLQKTASQTFRSKHSHFQAGSGLYVLPGGGIQVIGCQHHRAWVDVWE